MPEKKKPEETSEYHNTFLLLCKYRDVVWSLEVSAQKLKNRFKLEMGSSIEDFLESVYLAGINFAESGLTEYTKSIELSYKMLKLLESAVEVLRNKHKNGETYYWILYYSFLSPQQYRNAEEIIEQLEPYITDISRRTYYRKRKEAVNALSSVLWGYSSRDSVEILKSFFSC